jgi:hypothetical protein
LSFQSKNWSQPDASPRKKVSNEQQFLSVSDEHSLLEECFESRLMKKLA